MPSAQLTRYLELRGEGCSVATAADESGLSVSEAWLTEEAVQRGEIELPRARAPARACEKPSTREASVAQVNVAADELRLLIERIERLHEERQGIADDIKDVFQEAKSRGFDTKAMKQVMKLRKMETHTRAEAEAILATYLAALGMEPADEAAAYAVAA